MFEDANGVDHRLTHRRRHVVSLARGDHVRQVVVAHGLSAGSEVRLHGTH